MLGGSFSLTAAGKLAGVEGRDPTPAGWEDDPLPLEN